MKKLIFLSASFILAMALIVVIQSRSTTADSGFCYTCESGSDCQYCKSASGKDTSEDRKACEKKGCKVSGTASCPTAANYKVCK
jgi:hypothetical protein